MRWMFPAASRWTISPGAKTVPSALEAHAEEYLEWSDCDDDTGLLDIPDVNRQRQARTANFGVQTTPA